MVRRSLMIFFIANIIRAGGSCVSAGASLLLRSFRWPAEDWGRYEAGAPDLPLGACSVFFGIRWV